MTTLIWFQEQVACSPRLRCVHAPSRLHRRRASLRKSARPRPRPQRACFQTRSPSEAHPSGPVCRRHEARLGRWASGGAAFDPEQVHVVVAAEAGLRDSLLLS
eukprot:6186112-Pleurochrysis_carterae.AAC.4